MPATADYDSFMGESRNRDPWRSGPYQPSREYNSMQYLPLETARNMNDAKQLQEMIRIQLDENNARHQRDIELLAAQIQNTLKTILQENRAEDKPTEHIPRERKLKVTNDPQCKESSRKEKAHKDTSGDTKKKHKTVTYELTKTHKNIEKDGRHYSSDTSDSSVERQRITKPSNKPNERKSTLKYCDKSTSNKAKLRKKQHKRDYSTSGSCTSDSDDSDTVSVSNNTVLNRNVKRGYKIIHPPSYDGSTSFKVFLSQFDTAAKYNGWDKADKGAYLRTSLKGNAALLISSSCEQSASYRKMLKILQHRYNTAGQESMYRAELRSRRRRKNESLSELYQSILNLMSMAYPGRPSLDKDALAIESFLDALNDTSFELRIRDRDPKNLQEAFKIALTLESYEKSRGIKAHDEEIKLGNRARTVQFENDDNKLNKIKSDFQNDIVQINSKLRNLQQQMERNSNRFRSPDSQPITAQHNVSYANKAAKQDLNIICFNCHASGHIRRYCPALLKNPRYDNYNFHQQSGYTMQPQSIGNYNYNYRQPNNHNRVYDNNHRAAPSNYDKTIHDSIPNQPRNSSYSPFDVSTSSSYYNTRDKPAINGLRIENRSALERDADICYHKPVYLNAEFDGIQAQCLLDTGCDISTIPTRYVNTDKMHTFEERYMFAANGTPIKLRGEAIIDVAINGSVIPSYFVVTDHITEPMLSAHWLAENECQWDFQSSTLTVKNIMDPVALVARHETLSCRRLTAINNIEIAPWTRTEINTKLELNRISGEDYANWATAGTENKNGLLVANTLLPNRCHNIPIMVCNMTDNTMKIEADTIIAEVEPVEIICMNESSRIISEPNICESPEDYLHIQPLIEQLPEHLTTEQKSALITLLHKYSHIFSKHEYDLGETGIVKHTIDTGDSKPVRQSLRRHPREMLQKIDDQVQKLEQAGIVHKANSPWDRMSIDICGPYPRSNLGNRYILTAIDTFTKFAFAFPLRNHEAPTVAKILVERIFSYFGTPLELLSDCAPEYESKLMQELCSMLEISKLRTSGYKPSTNAVIERFHKTLNTMLGKVVQENQRNWDSLIPMVMMSYRSTTHSSTGFTPNFLTLGRELRSPLDIVLGTLNDDNNYNNYCEFVNEQRTKLTQAYELARKQLGSVAVKSTERYNLKLHPKEYNVGDFVYFYYPRKYANRSPKLQRLYKGPYKVIEKLGPVNVKIQITPRSKPFVVHIDKLKSYYGEVPRAWDKAEENAPQINDNFPTSEDSSISSSSDNDMLPAAILTQTEEAQLRGEQQEEETDIESSSGEQQRRPKRKIHKPARYM